MTDHFDGRRFFNPSGANGQPVSKLLELVRTPRARWPARVPVDRRVPLEPGPGQVVVTFVGHSTFLIRSERETLLTDPVFSGRAGPFGLLGPKRTRAAGVALADLPPISRVLLSHNHYDHCDLPALRWLAGRDHPVLVTPLGNARFGRAAGFERITELDWWQGSPSAVPVTLTPAQHFSARTPWDRNRALWGGFVIETTPGPIFFAGDSGYAPHFAEIRRRFGPMALALLPIGAYEPRWFMRDIHMDPDEAVAVHLELEARQSVAMHFGTFQLTPEPIDEPVAALRRALGAKNLAPEVFRVLEPGESTVLLG